ncbi:unnamed protein product [Lactuca saligna]|uniref:Uncharacterized protein n=1 Tax=Lactuca saligna TaxID=75948 RepID=A0AA36ECF9_LACSI|nr:unnamed protein product [Lactuca saligna]
MHGLGSWPPKPRPPPLQPCRMVLMFYQLDTELEDERDRQEESKKEREGFAGSRNLWRLEAKKENGEARLRGIQLQRVQQDHDSLHLWFGGFSGFSRLDGNDSVHPERVSEEPRAIELKSIRPFPSKPRPIFLFNYVPTSLSVSFSVNRYRPLEAIFRLVLRHTSKIDRQSNTTIFALLRAQSATTAFASVNPEYERRR